MVFNYRRLATLLRTWIAKKSKNLNRQSDNKRLSYDITYHYDDTTRTVHFSGDTTEGMKWLENYCGAPYYECDPAKAKDLIKSIEDDGLRVGASSLTTN